MSGVMTLELTDGDAALLWKELNGIIDGDRYFLLDRMRTLEAIRAKIRPEPAELHPAAGEFGEETRGRALRRRSLVNPSAGA